MKTKASKKVIALIVSLAMLLALMPATLAAEEWAVVTKGVTYDEASDEVTAALLNVKTSGKYTTYAAIYENNALVDVAADTSTLEKGDVTVTFDETLSFDSETQTLKVFVWNSSQRAVAKDYTYGDVVDDDTETEESESGGGAIHLNGDTIDISEVTAGVTLDETGTVATITLPGSYTVDGTLNDGQIAVNYTSVNATDTVTLTLDGASVTSSTGYAVNGISGDFTLASKEGTTSTITSSANDAVYSKANIEVKGDGTLNVVSTAGNGIRSKENVEVGKGTLNVTASTNGIKGDEKVKLTKKCGTVTITSGGDGITSDNAPTISKPSRTGEVEINGGNITIATSTYTNKSGETKNGDGIQADTLLTIAGGNININAAGEAIKSNFSHLDLASETGYAAAEETLAAGDGCIIVTGGTVNATAGEDGIKATKDVTVSGGSVTITQALDGIQVKEIVYTDSTETTVQDYVEGSVNISGGTLNITASEDGIQCGTGNITISGGDITVNSTQDGIQAEYVLNISDGTVNVTTNGGSPATVTVQGDSNSLADPGYSCKGLKAANLIYVTGGDITLNTYDDAVHTNDTVQLLGGTFNIQAGDDGVHGDSYLIVDDEADINITKCYEGLEAAKVYMNGGSSSIYATDDGINAAGTQPAGNALDLGSEFVLSSSSYTLAANQPPSGNGGSSGFGNNPTSSSSYGYLEINGGYIYVNNTQGDGIDANGSMVINGGVTIVDGATLQSEDGLDFDNGVTFNGGYVLTMTAGGMDSVSGSFSQKYLLYGFTSNGQGGFNGGKQGGGPGGQQPGSGSTGSSLSAGNYCIVDSDGNVLCAFSRTKSSIQRVLFSSPQVSASKTYYIKPLTVSGVTATDSLYGTVDPGTYAFTLAGGCSVNTSGTSYTMTAN